MVHTLGFSFSFFFFSFSGNFLWEDLVVLKRTGIAALAIVFYSGEFSIGGNSELSLDGSA